MNLANPATVRRLMGDDGFKKSLGQNFLIDDTVCPRMAEAAADKRTGVLEIGPGIGVLTRELSFAAKTVRTIELDRRLEKILAQTLKDLENTEVIFGDAMKLDLEKIIKESFADCERVVVCANLPYYITSPIIMKLLESRLPIDEIVVMVQKEAAERLCARVSSREAGAVTAAVEYYAESEILFGVGRESFMPPPKVDSAVIRLKIRKEPPVSVPSEEKFFSLIKACFAQRRKTLLNTVSSTLHIEKEALAGCLLEMGLEQTVRAEKLTLLELSELSTLLHQKGIF